MGARQGLGGLGVASTTNLGDLFFCAQCGTVNYAFDGLGETLFLTFDQQVNLNSVSKHYVLGGLFPTTTSSVSAIDANGNVLQTLGLNVWASTFVGSTNLPGGVVGARADLLGNVTFNVASKLPAAARYAFSGFVGLDHLDTNFILRGVDISPIPEPGTWALAVFGLAGLSMWRRRANAQG